MLNNYDECDIDEDAVVPMNYNQVLWHFKNDYQRFDVGRLEFIDYDLLQQMINDRRYAGRTSTERIKRNEYVEVTIKRILDNKDKEQIHNKGRGRNEVCHREYNNNGAQHLPRDVRTLVTKDYDSVDCDSCHPACLIAICRALNI